MLSDKPREMSRSCPHTKWRHVNQFGTAISAAAHSSLYIELCEINMSTGAQHVDIVIFAN